MNDYYYRPQPGLPSQLQLPMGQQPFMHQPTQQHFPGGPVGHGGPMDFRLDRLEREVNQLQRQNRNLERRVDAIERRLGINYY